MYEINIAKLTQVREGLVYKHFFATSPRSTQSTEDTQKLVDHFLGVYPYPAYVITVTKSLGEAYATGEFIDTKTAFPNYKGIL